MYLRNICFPMVGQFNAAVWGIYWQNLWLNKRKDSVRDFLQEIRIYEKHKKMQEALEALESRLDPQSPKLKFTSGFYNSLINSGPSLSFIKNNDFGIDQLWAASNALSTVYNEGKLVWPLLNSDECCRYEKFAKHWMERSKPRPNHWSAGCRAIPLKNSRFPLDVRQ